MAISKKEPVGIAARPAKGEEIGFAVRMGRRGCRALQCCGGITDSDVSMSVHRGSPAHLPLRGPSSFRGHGGHKLQGDALASG